MPEDSGARALSIPASDGVTLSGQQAGAGPTIVLLHGITATRRYVVMGSRLLERSGMRVIAYDARGHGQSSPASGRTAYGYERLAADVLAVLDGLGLDRAILAGASMGAHTIVRFALEHSERVAALGLITPAYLPGEPVSPPDAASTETTARAGTGEAAEPDAFAAWDALADGLRGGGVDGFMAAYDFQAVPDAWRATVETVVRQRLSAHEHPEAVADALEVVPRSRPFERVEDLAAIAAPTLVVASRDEADPGHPLAVGERYARTIDGAELIVEDAGPPARSPIAWQGGQLSKALLRLAERCP
jgi:pimeloyl-ACP methyl ester carboxylesterase